MADFPSKGFARNKKSHQWIARSFQPRFREGPRLKGATYEREESCAQMSTRTKPGGTCSPFMGSVMKESFPETNKGRRHRMKAKRILIFALALMLVSGFQVSGYAWDPYGHMAVAYVAYQKLTPQAMKRANDLIKLNPKYGEWSGWVPASATQADKDRMIFMLAATWPDEIKSDPSYTSDGSANGNRPEGSPD